MAAPRLIADRKVRHQQITAALATRTGSLRIPFRGGYRELPAGKIIHEHLLFRLANGRTIGEQRQVIAERSLPPDQFDDDASPTAQALQEDILAKMAEAKDLLAILKKQGQTEPLLVLDDGVIINGNRRLAGMRRLALEKTAVPAWPYVEIAALPADTTAEDILDIEARLQIAPDVKAEYQWFDCGLLYERLSNGGKTDADIAALYHVAEGANSVNEELKMLRLARDFLQSIGKPDGYGHLEKHYYAFKKLRDTIDAETDPAKRVLVQELAFRHLRSANNVGRRYDTMPAIRKHLDAITNRVVTEAKLSPVAPVSAVVAKLMGPGTTTPAVALHSVLLQGLRASQIRPDVVAKCIDEVIDEEERKTQDRQRLGALDDALDLAVDALKRAADQLAPTSASQVSAKSQLLIDQVVQRAAALQGQVRTRLNSAGASTP